MQYANEIVEGRQSCEEDELNTGTTFVPDSHIFVLRMLMLRVA